MAVAVDVTRRESLCDVCDISAPRVLFRASAGVVALPSQTVAGGHVMVVSAAHAASFSGLGAAAADAFMSLVSAAVRAAEAAGGGRHYYVLRIGDASPHLHFHLVPASSGGPPLAPFVFGEAGWAASSRGSAAPGTFERAFLEELQSVAGGDLGA